MVRIFDYIKIAIRYIGNLTFWNREGWYIGEPTSESQSLRILLRQKPYHQRTCKMCKRKFWSYNKPNVCFRIECYFTYHTQGI